MSRGREKGGGCGENKICCHLTSSRLQISQPDWGHGEVLSLHVRQNKGRLFFQESTGKSRTYRHLKGKCVPGEKGILLKFLTSTISFFF